MIASLLCALENAIIIRQKAIFMHQNTKDTHSLPNTKSAWKKETKTKEDDGGSQWPPGFLDPKDFLQIRHFSAKKQQKTYGKRYFWLWTRVAGVFSSCLIQFFPSLVEFWTPFTKFMRKIRGVLEPVEANVSPSTSVTWRNKQGTTGGGGRKGDTVWRFGKNVMIPEIVSPLSLKKNWNQSREVLLTNTHLVVVWTWLSKQRAMHAGS